MLLRPLTACAKKVRHWRHTSDISEARAAPSARLVQRQAPRGHQARRRSTSPHPSGNTDARDSIDRAPPPHRHPTGCPSVPRHVAEARSADGSAEWQDAAELEEYQSMVEQQQVPGRLAAGGRGAKQEVALRRDFLRKRPAVARRSATPNGRARALDVEAIPVPLPSCVSSGGSWVIRAGQFDR